MKNQRFYPLEILLWCIAMPGFGQFLNRKWIKGIVFILLEFLINVNSKLNLFIKYSFQGKAETAIYAADFEWMLFYPCVYIFSMFDGYIDALKISGQQRPPLLSIPFLTAAYLSTVSVIYSDKEWLYTYIPPVFIPIIGIIAGFILGGFVRNILLARELKELA
ncbi:hypothetical protein QYG89_10145 [Bacillus sp. B190/17]|uniref:Uncharacterized protein n=1 Tax=Bacillus lumedeiriae TaxID=3058829 RepID=A0ABW8I949_9BACI